MEPQWHAQAWFLDAHLLVADLRELFRVRAFNLSVAVWVGFLALFVPTAEKATPATEGHGHEDGDR